MRKGMEKRTEGHVKRKEDGAEGRGGMRGEVGRMKEGAAKERIK